MKRTFYLYKYRKDNSGLFNIHKEILKFIQENNKSLATVNQRIEKKYYYTITTASIPKEIFFSKANQNRRPVYICNPLIASFEGEDDSMFPSNENMNRLRDIDSITPITGPLNFRRYSIIINLNLEGLEIPFIDLF
jgi:hypothetical protein